LLNGSNIDIEWKLINRKNLYLKQQWGIARYAVGARTAVTEARWKNDGRRLSDPHFGYPFVEAFDYPAST